MEDYIFSLFIAVRADGLLFGILEALLALPVGEVIWISGSEWLASRAHRRRTIASRSKAVAGKLAIANLSGLCTRPIRKPKILSKARRQ